MFFHALHDDGRWIKNIYLPGDAELYEPIIKRVQAEHREKYLARKELEREEYIREREIFEQLQAMLHDLDKQKWLDD